MDEKELRKDGVTSEESGVSSAPEVAVKDVKRRKALVIILLTILLLLIGILILIFFVNFPMEIYKDQKNQEEEKRDIVYEDIVYENLEERCSLGNGSTFNLKVIYPNTIEVSEERDCVYKLSYDNSYLLLGYEAEKSREDYSVTEFSGEYEVIIENYRNMKPLVRVQISPLVYEYGHFRGENPCYGDVVDCRYNYNQTDQFIYAPLHLWKVFLVEGDNAEEVLDVFDKVIEDSEIERLDVG